MPTCSTIAIVKPCDTCTHAIGDLFQGEGMLWINPKAEECAPTVQEMRNDDEACNDAEAQKGGSQI